MKNKFWFLVYNLFIVYPFWVIVKIVGIFDRKVKRGIVGRKKLFEKLILSSDKIKNGKKLIWFHSSSLGEFEQAKPVIEMIKANKDLSIIVTFFSPSGYENSLKYPYADIVSYIPFDSYSNAQKFVSIVNPDLAVFMRYDYWPNHIEHLNRNKIPILIIDATMRGDSKRLLFFVKSFHINLFSKFSRVLTVSEEDKKAFLKFGLKDEIIEPVGDTRYDRVYQRSLIAKSKHLIDERITKGKFVFVAGSTWHEDEDIILPVFQKLTNHHQNLMVIIAPHEPTETNLEKLENDFYGKEAVIRFSNLNDYKGEKIILVDSIGILLTLYYYSSAAFIGGSFKASIHNVLEAAVYGIPVFYGPKINSSREARELAKQGGGSVLHNRKECYKEFKKVIENPEIQRAMGEISKSFVHSSIGATEKIYKEINNYIK